MKRFATAFMSLPAGKVAYSAIGFIILLSIVACSLVAQRYARLQSVLAEKIQAESIAQTRQTTLALEAQLQQENHTLTQRLAESRKPLSTEEMSIESVTRLNGLGSQHQITLASVTPAPARQVMALEEVPVDLQAKGDFIRLAAMLLSVPNELPGTAITEMTASRADDSDEVVMRLRVSLYRLAEQGRK